MTPAMNQMMTLRQCAVAGFVLATAFGLSACGSSSLIKDVFDGDSSSSASGSVPRGGALAPDMATADEKDVSGLYNGALTLLNNGSYNKAQTKFAEVERQHPYSKWATKSILLQAFCAYQRNAYGDAIDAGQRFIALHPGHKDVSYAYYLVAISNYEQIADVRRDQSKTTAAVEALDEVARRFPDSPYAADAKQKANVARDHLAGKEMEVGRYYLKKGSYLAGINRFKTVVTQYQTSTQTPEALYRLSEAYMALGVVSEARTAAAVLGHNYPNSEWYKSAYTLVSSDGKAPVADQGSWITRAFKSVNPFSSG
jgi:outer membrane protein assembly factor BamD